MAGSPIISPRNAYPLYFAIAGVLLPLFGGDPAHAINIITALESAVACGLLTVVAAQLGGSVLAGVASAGLFAVSYTFWSQSVMAEVYGLHMLCVSASLWLLLRWEARPTTSRLAAFFALYALGFGNHLSMVLLLPACTLFLLVSAPGGWRSLLTPRVVAVAGGLAAAGALQYAWNVRSLWFTATPPHGVREALAIAWFDITKSDWRETLVSTVPRSLLFDRVGMYVFDLRQQFGLPGIGLSALGLLALWMNRWRRALLVSSAYLVNLLFAYGYNVGDTHVFYLPSHLMLALMIAPGLAWVGTRAAGRTRHARTVAALLALVYTGVRAYHDYPALDRSGDRRPTEVLSRLTAELDDRHAILLTDLGWQVQNGLDYFRKHLRREVASVRVADVLLYAPALLNDNQAIGREAAVTAKAAATVSRAFGPLLPCRVDSRAAGQRISDLVAGLPNGTAYVLCILKPTRDYSLDEADLTGAIRTLTGNESTAAPSGDYAAIAGHAGQAPSLVAASNAPFRRSLPLGSTDVEIRMDSWLAADTIRRMGFGHVIASRRHSLIVERGVSFVAWNEGGEPIRSGYASGIFAAEPRYLCYR